MPAPIQLTSHQQDGEASGRRAELLYLQKQMQERTPMVVVLEDGERLEGLIEWFDRDAIKLVGRQRSLVYKAAIRYMYKAGAEGR